MMYTVNLRIFGRSAGRGMKALGLCAETAIFRSNGELALYTTMTRGFFTTMLLFSTAKNLRRTKRSQRTARGFSIGLSDMARLYRAEKQK